MNTKANIMYFIEQFLQLASKDGQGNYVRMMQRDIIRVVDAVAPDDGTGSANVGVVRKVPPPPSLPSHLTSPLTNAPRSSTASAPRASSSQSS